jgi:CDP-diacylglycerol--serine O-phosphatidyltransferase
MAFIYVACAALRLARFNTQIDTADKNYFSGLASPAAAAVVAGLVWVCYEMGYVPGNMPKELAVFAGCLTAAMGFLMVSNVPYHSFKGLDLKGRVPFVMMIVVILLFGLITLDPALILLLGFLVYTLSGPIMSVVGKLRGS